MALRLNLKTIWLCLLLSCFVEISRTLNLGQDSCLINRIDVIPCNIVDSGVSLPGQDQYAVYGTKFYYERKSQNSPRIPKCKLRKEHHRVFNIDKSGGNIKNIYSPGFKNQKRYGNQMFVDYNIHCGKGQFAYVNITTLQLQRKNCKDPNLYNKDVCVDYLRLEHANGYGATEVCGRDASPLINHIESSDSFRMIFRSSWRNRNQGFEGVVICFDPGMANQPSCTGGGDRTKRSEEAMPETLMNPVKRQTRRLESTLEERIEDRDFLEEVPSIFTGRRETVKIPYGVYAVYRDNMLRFYDADTGKYLPKKTVVEIRTFRMNELNEFFGQAQDRQGEFIQFRGPTDLLVTGTYANIQKPKYDLESLLPTQREAEILSDMVQSFLKSVRETADIPEELLDPPPIIHESADDDDEPTLPTFPRFTRATLPHLTLPTPSLPPIRLPPKREEKPIIIPRPPRPPHFEESLLRRQKRAVERFTDHSVMLALDNENACNPVLRTSSQTVIQRLENIDPVRLTTLRKFHERQQPEF